MSQQHTPSNATIEAQYDNYIMPIWKSLDTPIKRAHGTTLEDFDGNEYLDLFSGIAVTNLGHTNDAVVDAATNQLEEFTHGCSYVHPNKPMADLAERLADITPGNLEKSFFCNSGTEAVEGAIKLARKYTGSKEVVSLEMGFHGRTLGSLALTGNNSYKEGMAPTLNDATHFKAPYAYRCPRCDGDHCTATCADTLERVIQTHTSDDIAAVIVEPLMGEAGLIVPSTDWFDRIATITRDHDALLIIDEVQAGYGRTGEFWGIDHYDIEPDIITQAKGIANGLPLGAFTASPTVADAFESGDHLSTFGGNPVACAAALATIDQLTDGVIDNAAEQGAFLDAELDGIADEYDVVGDARGRGLMRGLEIVNPSERGPADVAPAPAPKLATRLSDALRDHGIVVGVGGFHKNVLRLQPPLTITADELETAIDTLHTVLANEVDDDA